MTTQYENISGILIKRGTDECAGYIFNFTGHGAFAPGNKVETETGPTQEEIDTHNAILANAEKQAMIDRGKGTFYLTKAHPYNIEYQVTMWASHSWKSPWCYVRQGKSVAFGGWIDAYTVWFTGPDGKKWYGVNKGNMDCFTGRRLKIQDK